MNNPKASANASCVTASVACAMLGINAQTLYAYVSRGFVRAVQDPCDARKSLYLREDIQTRMALKKRGRSRRAVAKSVLDWGEPALVSSITQIRDGQTFYRGQDCVELSEYATLEDIAALLMQRNLGAARQVNPSQHAGQGTPPFARMLTTMAQNAGSPDEAGPLDLVQALVTAATGQWQQGEWRFHQQLAQAWGLDAAGADMIRRVLVLCADHELNASAFATRVTASTGATPAACLLTGLATLSGPKHGGMVERALQWMEWAATQDRVRPDDTPAWPPPGFGHPLYPLGDPRALAMFQVHPAPEKWQRIITHLADHYAIFPSLDIGLAHVVRYLRLPPGSGLVLFAIGRSVGWLAHSEEQRSSGQLIRPRARETGPVKKWVAGNNG